MNGEAVVITTVVAETVVIAGLILVLWWRKRANAQAEARSGSSIQQPFLAQNDESPFGAYGGAQSQYSSEALGLSGPMPYRGVVLITIGMSAGYACLVLLQHHLMDLMWGNVKAADTHGPSSHGGGGSSSQSSELYSDADALSGSPTDKAHETEFQEHFEHAASFEYIGNLIFRLAHNFVFASVVPRQRVYIALMAMGASMLIISIVIYHQQATSINWVYLAYSLGGVGWGTFESNLLSTITPLGHDTKVWAITGIPLGFCSISVVGFLLRSPPEICGDAIGRICGLNPEYLYYYVVAMLAVGVLVLLLYVPSAPIVSEHSKAGGDRNLSIRRGLSEAEQWLPLIQWNCVALMVQMYALSFFTSIPFYIYNDDSYSLGGGKFHVGHVSLVHATGSTMLMNTERWLAVFNMHTFLGDTISRKMAYYFKPLPVMAYLLVTGVGAFLALIKVPILFWTGLFLIFMGNGSIYATTTKHIDQNVGRQYNLLALSVWLFVGDIGSVLGSNTWEYAKPLLCEGKLGAHPEWKHFCIAED